MPQQIPEFYPGYTTVWGRGEMPRTTTGQRMRRPGITRCVGAGTSEEPSILYMYSIRDCEWLTPERRPYFEEELRQLAIKSNMKCVIVRAPGPHNWTVVRDKVTGTIVTERLAPGWIENKTKSAEWHVTIFMGEDFENVYVQGHIFTCMVPNPHASSPEKILKIMDDPRTQRKDGLDCNMEFWLVSQYIQYQYAGSTKIVSKDFYNFTDKSYNKTPTTYTITLTGSK